MICHRLYLSTDAITLKCVCFTVLFDYRDLKLLSLESKMTTFKIKHTFPVKKTQQDSQKLNLVMATEIIPAIN